MATTNINPLEMGYATIALSDGDVFQLKVHVVFHVCEDAAIGDAELQLDSDDMALIEELWLEGVT